MKLDKEWALMLAFAAAVLILLAVLFYYAIAERMAAREYLETATAGELCEDLMTARSMDHWKAKKLLTRMSIAERKWCFDQHDIPYVYTGGGEDL